MLSPGEWIRLAQRAPSDARPLHRLRTAATDVGKKLGITPRGGLLSSGSCAQLASKLDWLLAVADAEILCFDAGSPWTFNRDEVVRLFRSFWLQEGSEFESLPGAFFSFSLCWTNEATIRSQCEDFDFEEESARHGVIHPHEVDRTLAQVGTFKGGRWPSIQAREFVWEAGGKYPEAFAATHTEQRSVDDVGEMYFSKRRCISPVGLGQEYRRVVRKGVHPALAKRGYLLLREGGELQVLGAGRAGEEKPAEVVGGILDVHLVKAWRMYPVGGDPSFGLNRDELCLAFDRFSGELVYVAVLSGGEAPRLVHEELGMCLAGVQPS